MKVTMSKTLQIAPYEPLSLTVEVDDSDFRFRFDKTTDMVKAMQLFAYSQILDFQVLHGHMEPEFSQQELARAKKALLPQAKPILCELSDDIQKAS